MKYIVEFTMFVGWVAGIVIAHGFWSTFFAVLIPFYSWYLLIERLVERFL